jgi:molybdopterin synthase sulfur carrier subunit
MTGVQQVVVRFYAGARAAAGLAEERMAAGGTLAELIADLEARHGQRLGKVLAAAAFLVDGVSWHDRHACLPAGATIDVLPPFAGG